MFRFIKCLRNIKSIEVYDPLNGCKKVSNWKVIVAGFVFIILYFFLVVSFISMTFEIRDYLKNEACNEEDQAYSLTVLPCPIISSLSKFKERDVFFVVDSHLKASAKDNETSNNVQDKAKGVHFICS